MLLNFSFSNFRSFSTDSTLEMTPDKIRDFSYSVLKSKTKNKKALCSSVIYGANASGKSNLILAMAFLKELILSGNLKNQRCIPLELIPCFSETKERTIDFSISFINQDILFDYQLKIGNLHFLEDDVETAKIEYEKLAVNEKDEFVRENSNIEIFGNNVNELFKDKAKESLLDDELFLTNGYKTLLNTDYYSVLLDWFQEKLVIVKNINYVSSVPKFDYENIGDAVDNQFKLSDEIINKIAKEAGINAGEIHYSKGDKDKKPQAISVVNGKGVIARFIESAGTMKIINFLPLVISTMVKGGTLIIDELDSSLHPSAVFSIINAFHNNELNMNKAQLIFTSHNPIYLKAKIFRRDEIKFIEREDNNSTIYSLSSFGTSGKDQVKNTTDIMKNYLTGKYKAINYIDFSEIIYEAMLLNGCKGENNG